MIFLVPKGTFPFREVSLLGNPGFEPWTEERPKKDVMPQLDAEHSWKGFILSKMLLKVFSRYTTNIWRSFCDKKMEFSSWVYESSYGVDCSGETV
jgi:hypothetical protein